MHGGPRHDPENLSAHGLLDHDHSGHGWNRHPENPDLSFALRPHSDGMCLQRSDASRLPPMDDGCQNQLDDGCSNRPTNADPHKTRHAKTQPRDDPPTPGETNANHPRTTAASRHCSDGRCWDAHCLPGVVNAEPPMTVTQPPPNVTRQ